jgi:flagellar protein FlbD
LIRITDVSGKEKFLNCDLIEKIEAIPDTLLVLVTGRNFIVKESPEEIVERIAEFKRRCNSVVSAPMTVLDGSPENASTGEETENAETTQ